MKKLIYFIIVASCYADLLGQWDLEKRIQLAKKPSSYAVDSQDQLYLGFEDGSMIKFSAQGKEHLNYALSNQSPVTLIDPQFQLKTFLFLFDNQSVIILDRFSGLPKKYELRDLTLNIVSSSCPAPDGTFWIIENNPIVLKRLNPNQNQVIVETQPEVQGKILHMRAYQNILLVLDEIALHLFDQFGTRLSSFNCETQFFQVKDDLVFVVVDDHLVGLEIFGNLSLSSKVKLPVSGAIWLQTESMYLAILENSIEYYRRQ
ncbi:MAG: hypothetical protein AAF616_07575 [Bacteroidota bacterium]